MWGLPLLFFPCNPRLIMVISLFGLYLSAHWAMSIPVFFITVLCSLPCFCNFPPTNPLLIPTREIFLFDFLWPPANFKLVWIYSYFLPPTVVGPHLILLRQSFPDHLQLSFFTIDCSPRFLVPSCHLHASLLLVQPRDPLAVLPFFRVLNL